jgi:gamma-glutamyltranspeptidase/glutathione hydrolase
MLGDDRGFLACVGVVGGLMQPQGHFQVIRDIFDRHMSVADAVAAPRFRLGGGLEVAFEAGYNSAIVDALIEHGHEASVLDRFEAGGAQIVMRFDTGFVGASDPRRDGFAAGT